MSGWGVKVKTDTGRFVWLTKKATAIRKDAKGVLSFETVKAAADYAEHLLALNPGVTLITEKL